MVYCIKETAVIGLGSKITVNGDCSHAIKGCLLLGRKVMTNPDSTLKNRDITLWTKVHIVKPMVFPVVMSGCESRTIKEAERWRIDSFELQCLRRVLRVPWTIRRSNQSFLGNQLWIFIGRTVAEAEAPVLWLPDVKSQLTGKGPWCWERRKARGDGGNRGRDGWMALLIQRTWTWANSGRWWGTGKPGVLQSMGSQRVGHNLVIEQQQIFYQTDGQHFICLLLMDIWGVSTF